MITVGGNTVTKSAGCLQVGIHIGELALHLLEREHLEKILHRLLEEVGDRLDEQNIALRVTRRARGYLIDNGSDEKYGARPLRRLIQKEVEDPLSLEILRGRFLPGSGVTVDVKDDRLVFRKRRSVQQTKELVTT